MIVRIFLFGMGIVSIGGLLTVLLDTMHSIARAADSVTNASEQFAEWLESRA